MKPKVYYIVLKLKQIDQIFCALDDKEKNVWIMMFSNWYSLLIRDTTDAYYHSDTKHFWDIVSNKKHSCPFGDIQHI